MIECITDPIPSAPAWYDSATGNEIMDMCNQKPTQVSISGQPYSVQVMWDGQSRQCISSFTLPPLSPRPSTNLPGALLLSQQLALAAKNGFIHPALPGSMQGTVPGIPTCTSSITHIDYNAQCQRFSTQNGVVCSVPSGMPSPPPRIAGVRDIMTRMI